MPRITGSLTSDRRRLVAFGALELLAREGIQGLTHRRLDRSLDLPEGSSSNVFPRRLDLQRAAIDALVVQDRAVAESVLHDRPNLPWNIETAARVLTDVILAWLRPENRRFALARYTLLLEAPRQPELASIMLTARGKFTALAEQLCSNTRGTTDRAEVALQLVAWADGVLIAHLVDASNAPSPDRILQGAREFLSA